MKQINKLNMLLLIAGIAPAAAATVTVTLDPNYPSDYSFYTYTDATGDSNTLAVSPYLGTLSGGGYLPTQSYYLWCYDINVDMGVGVPYKGTVEAPTTRTQIEAAYLENQVVQLGGNNAPTSEIGPYDLAIWQLMDPSSYNSAPFAEDPAARPLIAEAVEAYKTGAWTKADASQFAVWTPYNLGSAQRFGLIAVPAEAPEPASFALIGLGLVAVSIRYQHKKQ